MKIKPIKNKIFIEQVKPEKETKSGIVLSDEAVQESIIEEGDVIAVGPEVLDVKVGDRVSFARYSNSRVKTRLEGKEYIVIKEEDISFVIEK